MCCCCAVIPVAAVNKDRSMSYSFLGSSSDIVDSSSGGIVERLNDFLIGLIGPRGLYDRDQETDRFDIGCLDGSLTYHSVRRSEAARGLPNERDYPLVFPKHKAV